jgi:hypothetical protein
LRKISLSLFAFSNAKWKKRFDLKRMLCLFPHGKESFFDSLIQSAERCRHCYFTGKCYNSVARRTAKQRRCMCGVMILCFIMKPSLIVIAPGPCRQSGGSVGENEKMSLSAISIDKAELACEKEFGHLLESDSAARYGDPYAKYIDNALVRLDGMAAFAECLLEGYAVSMTVSRIFSGWRNRLQAARDCKENMRVFSRSEKEVVKLFREYCRGCMDMAANPPDGGRVTATVWKEYARQRKEAVLSFLGELFTIPELYEIDERYAIPLDEEEMGKNAGGVAEQPEKTVRISVELTEKEARAYETLSRVEQKIRAALVEAEQESK